MEGNGISLSMPPVCRRRPAIWRPAPSLVCSPEPTSAPGPVRHGRPARRTAPALEPAPASELTDVLLRQLIESCIEQARDQLKRDNYNRPLKPRNPDLYYCNLHMECYYFCQQCEDHFDVAGSQEHKRVPFAAGFLRDHILN